MSDPIAHPPHYTLGGIEVIDAIEAWQLNFHLGNVVKYVARADRKGDRLNDLRKARWYLEREIERGDNGCANCGPGSEAAEHYRKVGGWWRCGVCGVTYGVEPAPVAPPAEAAPIDMVLHCPRCRMQHVDAPQPEKDWTNPPHRSHECQGCGMRWRVADVPTNGVENCRTRGSGDTWEPPFPCVFPPAEAAPLASGEATRVSIPGKIVWLKTLRGAA